MNNYYSDQQYHQYPTVVYTKHPTFSIKLSDTYEIYLGENWILCSVVIVTEHFIGFQVLLNDLQLGFIPT